MDQNAVHMDLKDLDPDQMAAWKEGRSPKAWEVSGNVYVQTLGKMFDNFSGWVMPSENMEKTLSVLTHEDRSKALQSKVRGLDKLLKDREALETSFSVQGGEQIRRFLVKPRLQPVGQFFRILFSKLRGT